MAGEDLGAEAARPRLCDFIDGHRSHILARWERSVRQGSGTARSLSHPVLLDHMPEVLERIAAITRTVHEGGEVGFDRMPEIHALDRLDRGFDLQVVVDEYAALRTCALELYRERCGLAVVEEVQRFDHAIDEAIRASVTQFARTRERLLAALDRISSTALAAPQLQELLPRLLSALMDSAEAVDSVTLLMLEGELLRVRAAVGLTAERDANFSLQVGQGFSGTIAATRKPLALRDATNDPLVVSQHIRDKRIRALYGVPLMVGDELVGVAHMGSLTAYAFSEEDRQLFRTTASRAAQFISAAKLREERARAQQQLEEEHEQNQALITALGDFGEGLAVVEGVKLTYANEALSRITGYSQAQLVALDDLRTLAVEPSPEMPAALLFAEGPVRFEARFRRQDGELRDLEVTAKPIAAGRRVVLVRDVTVARRQTEDIRAGIAFRDQLISILSHDLRNPLAAIRGTAQLLMRRGSQLTNADALGKRIDSAALRMTEMLSGLLDFTQTRFRGPLPVQPAPANLRAICEQVVDETRSAFAGAVIESQYAGDLQGRWDADRLAQLVANLLSNAVTHGAPDQPVTLRLDGSGPEVMLEVHNGGAPIPEALLPRLFEAFTRGGERVPGTGFGLGLYIADQVVRAHGGSIAVHSAAGTGTSFVVRLPREPPPGLSAAVTARS